MLTPRAFAICLTLCSLAILGAGFGAGYYAGQRPVAPLIEKTERALRENAALKDALMLPEPTPGALEGRGI